MDTAKKAPTQTMREFARAVGWWWFAAILNALGAIQEIGKWLSDEWDGVVPSDWLYLIGTVLLVIGAYRAYRKVALERDVLKPQVDLTVEFERRPHHENFAGSKGVIVENVWIHDHITPRYGEHGVLDFELILEWGGKRWYFDKHPFQELYRNASQTIQDAYFSIPWQIKKNLRRHLILVENEPMLIPDQAMASFALRITDIDSGQVFVLRKPGRYRLTLNLDGTTSQAYEAISS